MLGPNDLFLDNFLAMCNTPLPQLMIWQMYTTPNGSIYFVPDITTETMKMYSPNGSRAAVEVHTTGLAASIIGLNHLTYCAPHCHAAYDYLRFWIRHYRVLGSGPTDQLRNRVTATNTSSTSNSKLPAASQRCTRWYTTHQGGRSLGRNVTGRPSAPHDELR